jgi:hypothetical protein
MKDLELSKTLVTRLTQEVTMYGFRVVAAALAQVAYNKANIFRKQLGDETNAVRWEISARSIMSAGEVIPPYRLVEPGVHDVIQSVSGEVPQ